MASDWFLPLVGVVSLLKILLMPAYHSTDFEVHRNWLAITHSLPVSKWYYEATSEWTLDYPPFFAYFEWCLSHIAALFDPKMVEIQKEAYDSTYTVYFQRLSVIVADLLFVYAVKRLCEKAFRFGKPLEASNYASHPTFILAVLLIGNYGLMLIDHIHFQYNGFLFGMQLLSIVHLWQGSGAWCAFWFATLLNFKHIYLYVAPVYFLYLLRAYCFRQSNKDGSVMWSSFSILRLLLLGIIVVAVFGASFGPFMIPQVLSRLFPFKRGLCHAYWAPNFWAFYNFVDKSATVVALKSGFISNTSLPVGTMTGGLVQEYQHTILPSIGPPVTLACTLLSILPSLFHLWRHPNRPVGFLRCLTLCALGSFMFGWHVHEKAILMATIPLSILALLHKSEAGVFLLLSTTGHFSLFPLIYTVAETPIKVGLMLFYTIFAFHTLGTYHRSKTGFHLPLLSFLESAYILGLIPVYVSCNILYGLTSLAERLPFLPLMITSIYSAIGVIYSWLKLYWIVLRTGGVSQQKKVS